MLQSLGRHHLAEGLKHTFHLPDAAWCSDAQCCLPDTDLVSDAKTMNFLYLISGGNLFNWF